jgi:hypothetical protein
MKVKIIKNVVAAQKVLKKDQVVDLDRKTAGVLVDGAFAVEHKEEAGGKKAAAPEEPAEKK